MRRMPYTWAAVVVFALLSTRRGQRALPRNEPRGGGIEGASHLRRLARRAASYFGLAEGEARACGYFALLFFLLGMGLAIGRGSANALFLKRYGVAHLPEAFALVGLSLAVASIVYAALADRVRPERVLVGILLVLAGLLGMTWLLIVGPELAPAYPGYFVLFEVASELLALHLTLYFASNFDVLQTKRLLPLGLASLQAGVVLGGGVLAKLASGVGTEHGPAVWAGLAALAAALVMRRHTRQGPSLLFRPARKGGDELRRAAEQIVQGMRFARGSSLLRYSAIGIFFMVVSLYCASYAYKAVFVEAFPGEEELAVVFGALSFVTGVATLLVQLFFTSRLLQRFGVRTMNLVFPVTTVVATVLLLFFPGLAAAVLVVLNRHVVMPSIRNPVRGLLFEALPDGMQGRARALSLGLVLPLALLAAGGLLAFASTTVERGPAMLWPALATAILFVVFSIRTNAAYVSSMLLTLKERLYLPEAQASEVGRGGDGRLLEELEAGVMHGDEQVAIAYARVLVRAHPDRAADLVLRRLQTASARARDVLLRLIGPHLSRQQIEGLDIEGIDAHETSTRMELHFAAAGSQSARLIPQSLASDNPRLVACGVVGAWRSEDPGLRQRAVEALDGLLGSGRDTAVIAGLEALRKVRVASHPEYLYGLLQHPSARVQRLCLEALAALGKADASRLEPLLEYGYANGDPHVRVACVRCAALLDPRARGRLCLSALNDDHPEVVKAALATLHEMDEDFESLMSRCLCDEAARPRVQEVVLDYLKSHGLLPGLLPAVAEQKVATAEAMAQIVSILDRPGHPRGGEDARALLRIVLQERIEQSIALALSALESAEDPHRMRIVRASLRGQNRRQVARGIEALSHAKLPLAAVRLRDLLLLLNGSPRRAIQVFPDAAAAMQWAARSTDTWLRQCAEFALPAVAGAQGRP